MPFKNVQKYGISQTQVNSPALSPLQNGRSENNSLNVTTTLPIVKMSYPRKQPYLSDLQDSLVNSQKPQYIIENSRDDNTRASLNTYNKSQSREVHSELHNMSRQKMSQNFVKACQDKLNNSSMFHQTFSKETLNRVTHGSVKNEHVDRSSERQ